MEGMKIANKRVLVTGGAGFLGSWVVRALKNHGVRQLTAPSSAEYDLREKDRCERLVANHDIVVHLAAYVGGIALNYEHPGRMFYDNALMGIHLLEAARKARIEKILIVGTACSYPKYCPVPFREEDLWTGYPEEITGVYGMVKKMLLVQAQAYRSEYGMNAAYVIPVNLYGPGDTIDPSYGHVIPSLIHRMMDAKRRNKRSLTIWGSGAATREFLYAQDAAEGIVCALERYDSPQPINLATGQEISIRDLVALLLELTGYSGNIVWDPSKPDGQPRRCLDTARCRKEIGFTAKTSLEEGLKKTIEWYKEKSRL